MIVDSFFSFFFKKKKEKQTKNLTKTNKYPIRDNISFKEKTYI